MNMHEQMANMARKIAAMRKYEGSTYLLASLSLMQDNKCATALLALDQADLDVVIQTLRADNPNDLVAEKMEIVSCYQSELQKLAEINLRDLTGLTRDDIARIQRSVAGNRKLSSGKRSKMMEMLTSMMLDFQEAEYAERDMIRGSVEKRIEE